MPSGHLYFPPLVDAYAKSAPVAGVPAIDRSLADRGLRRCVERRPDDDTLAPYDAILVNGASLSVIAPARSIVVLPSRERSTRNGSLPRNE